MLRLPAASLISRLESLGLLRFVWPELAALRGVTQSPPHRLDVWEHTLLTVARLEQIIAMLRGVGVSFGWLEPLRPLAPALRQHLETPMSDERPLWLSLKHAALLHDIGKPATRSVSPEGRVRFLGHEERGATLAREAVSRLHFSAAEADFVASVVRCHMRPLSLLAGGGVTPVAAHRYFRDIGPAGVDVALFFLADLWAMEPGAGAPAQGPAVVSLVVALLNYWLAGDSPEVQRPLVSGGDIMEFCSLSPGPQIGALLRRIREEQIAGRLGSKDDALQWAARHIQESQTHA
jgi:putative nucleotidyltransferase with HDIG domain